MSKADQIMRAKMLLHEALNLAGQVMPNNQSMAEVRFHMRQAMNKIDKIAKSQLKDKKIANQSQFENWWGNVVSGTAAASHTPMSSEARNRTLGQLDAMIAEEYKKLEELEAQTPTPPDMGSDGGASLFHD